MPTIITSNQHLFRRCGVAHPKGATEYPDDRFTDDELAILAADPMLTVQVTVSDPKTVLTEAPAPEPELPEMPEAGILATIDKDPKDLTVAELTDLLGKLGIEIPAKSKKADLLALLEANTAPPAEA